MQRFRLLTPTLALAVLLGASGCITMPGSAGAKVHDVTFTATESEIVVGGTGENRLLLRVASTAHSNRHFSAIDWFEGYGERKNGRVDFTHAIVHLATAGSPVKLDRAGALAARKLQIAVGHVEAGERSYDWSMPEEHNRRMIDHISDVLFITGEKARGNLQRAGVHNAEVREADGAITVTCEFCSTRYRFEDADLSR